MKNKIISKLGLKFIAGFIVLGIAICSTTCTIGYQKYKKTIEKLYNDNAYKIADEALSFVNGDDIERYLKTNDTDAAYDLMGKYLTDLRNSMSVNYLYIAKLEGIDLTYVYDVENPNDEYPPFVLGDTGKINPAFEEDAKIITSTGKRVDNYFYSESQFGYNTSAIVPVYSSDQRIVAILGVEISMTLIKETLREYVIYAIVVSSLLVALMIFIYMTYINRKVVHPINVITSNAAGFVDANNVFSDEVTRIKTNDEIQTLAVSLIKMERDIRKYINNLAKITADKERIATELSVATSIQASMLPCIFPDCPQANYFSVFATMTPAKEVGGDFYDFFLVDDEHLAVTIADVSGKGVPAALFMVIAKTLIKNHLHNGSSPADVFTLVNTQLCENNDACMFVTAFLGILNLKTGEFTYANAGHNPPLIKRAGGSYEWIKIRPGFVLAGMDGLKYQQDTLMLSRGDRIYMYTDGVTESLSINEELYGEERLRNILNNAKPGTLQELLEKVKNDVDSFAEGTEQADDITMLGLEYKG